MLDGCRPGLPGRLQVGVVPSFLGAQETVSSPLVGMGGKTLAQLFYLRLCGPHGGVYARVVLAVEAEYRCTYLGQRLQLGRGAVIDHGGTQVWLNGRIVKTLASSPAE